MFHIAHVDLTPIPVHDAVARMAAWLDVRKPGWAGLVDTDTLNLDDPRTCLLGQVFRDEAAGLGPKERYGAPLPDVPLSGYSYVAYGFAGPVPFTGAAGIFSNTYQFRHHWIAAIDARRASAG